MRLRELVEQAGSDPATPIGLATVDRSGTIKQWTTGVWPDGRPVTVEDRFYVASLAKQVTGVAVAILVRDGRLDADAPVSRYLSGLPAWAERITSRQLAHHTAGLLAAGEIEGRLGSSDWTMDWVLADLTGLPDLQSPPGRNFTYSNVGYILLARIVAEIAGEPFADFVQTQLLDPLGIDGMVVAGPRIDGFPQATLLGPSRPLTVGDGGIWSSVGAFAQWLAAQNRDAFAVASIVEAPAHLTTGEVGDYGWGIGLRTYADKPFLLHAGQWGAAIAKAVRSPSLGIGVVAMSHGLSLEALDALIDTALRTGISA